MRVCRVCKARYTATRAMQPTCGAFECQVEYGQQAAAKAKAKRDKASRVETKEKLRALDGPKVLEPKARKALQAFRREEDLANGYGCISCGKMPGDPSLSIYGHQFDGGHLRSVGSSKHLSLTPENIHAQCVYCNRELKGNQLAFRKGLIVRYGIAYVEKLENDNTPRHYTREQLIEIAETYRKKLRDLRNKP